MLYMQSISFHLIFTPIGCCVDVSSNALKGVTIIKIFLTNPLRALHIKGPWPLKSTCAIYFVVTQDLPTFLYIPSYLQN